MRWVTLVGSDEVWTGVEGLGGLRQRDIGFDLTGWGWIGWNENR